MIKKEVNKDVFLSIRDLVVEYQSEGKTVHAAVSYTHLDVYKRQVLIRPAAFAHPDRNIEPEAWLQIPEQRTAFRRKTIIMDMDAPVIACRVKIVVKYFGVGGSLCAF